MEFGELWLAKGCYQDTRNRSSKPQHPLRGDRPLRRIQEHRWSRKLGRVELDGRPSLRQLIGYRCEEPEHPVRRRTFGGRPVQEYGRRRKLGEVAPANQLSYGSRDRPTRLRHVIRGWPRPGRRIEKHRRWRKLECRECRPDIQRSKSSRGSPKTEHAVCNLVLSIKPELRTQRNIQEYGWRRNLGWPYLWFAGR